MGQPAVENNNSLSEESLEAIDPQMEQPDTHSGQEEPDTKGANKDSEEPDQELDLNAEAPPAPEEMERIAESASPSGGDEQGVTTEADADTDSFQADGAAQADDETGIDISDDELWEEDDIEEIPLFEEEFLEQELETQEKGQEPDETESPATEDTEEVEEEVETTKDHQSPEGEETPHPSVKQQESGATSEEEETKVEPKDDSSPKDLVASEHPEHSGGFRALLPWIITAISSALCVGAAITIWLIASNAQTGNQELTQTAPAKVETETNRPVQKQTSANPAVAPVRGTVQAIDLAPFLIPAQKSGELVFFKLKVELIVPNATTKQELLRREAWVRDIIYQELKGINISRGIKGDILTRYRRPLLNRLNQEMAPLRIEDIRFMGFLLR